MRNANGTTSFDDVKAILISSKTLQFQFKNVAFTDFVSVFKRLSPNAVEKVGQGKFCRYNVLWNSAVTTILFSKNHLPTFPLWFRGKGPKRRMA